MEVSFKVDERVYAAINPQMTLYVDGVEYWSGRVGETARVNLVGKATVKIDIKRIPIVSKGGVFEEEIDPGAGTAYILKPVRKTFNTLHFKAFPA